MSKKIVHNILGDNEAEHDHSMLDRAFFESPDYRALIESSDRNIVVGRRGVGKSALAYMLDKYWQTHNTRIINIVPVVDQVLATRPFFEIFSQNVTMIRTAAKLSWKYALLMSAIEPMSYGIDQSDTIHSEIRRWREGGSDTTSRLLTVLNSIRKEDERPESLIGRLANDLSLNYLHDWLKARLQQKSFELVFIVDKLDEGYMPDTCGIGFVTGLFYAALEINRLEKTRVYLFARDNIFRAVHRTDPDASKSLEGHIWRLHWDEPLLFSFVANRLKAAFALEEDNSLKIWNRCTANSLQSKDGFKLCLRHTLYRPRDLLSLLNNSFLSAQKHDRKEMVEEDIAASAKTISDSRLQELFREYESEFPGLEPLTRAFTNATPFLTYGEAVEKIESILALDEFTTSVQRSIRLVGSGGEAIRLLYGVGFIGIRDKSAGGTIFSHDGRSPDRAFGERDTFLVHPCFWMALGIKEAVSEAVVPEEIFDEYDVSMRAESQGERIKNLGRLMNAVSQIPEGDEGSQAFENWCLKALEIVFAGHLRNLELKPNPGNAVQRRDVVGRNLAAKGIWSSISAVYGSHQVVFECKNYRDLSSDDYRQLAAYLTGAYGNIAFVISRDTNWELAKNRDKDWVKEIYYTSQPRKLIVKLTAKLLSDWLSKLRSPVKHDVVEERFSVILDNYERNYLSLTSTTSRVRAKKKK